MSGFKYVGKKIYYLIDSGNVILDTGEAEGWIKILTKEEDFETYEVLKQYNKEKIDCVELQYGEFRTEFSECTSYRINPQTKDIIFDYSEIPPVPDISNIPNIYKRVENLELEKKEMEELIFEQQYQLAELKLNAN